MKKIKRQQESINNRVCLLQIVEGEVSIPYMESVNNIVHLTAIMLSSLCVLHDVKYGKMDTQKEVCYDKTV